MNLFIFGLFCVFLSVNGQYGPPSSSGGASPAFRSRPTPIKPSFFRQPARSAAPRYEAPPSQSQENVDSYSPLYQNNGQNGQGPYPAARISHYEDTLRNRPITRAQPVRSSYAAPEKRRFRQEEEQISSEPQQPSGEYGQPAQEEQKPTYGPPPAEEQSTESSPSGGYPESEQKPNEQYGQPAQEEQTDSEPAPAPGQSYGAPERFRSSGQRVSSQPLLLKNMSPKQIQDLIRTLQSYIRTRNEGEAQQPSGEYGQPAQEEQKPTYGPPAEEQTESSPSGGYPASGEPEKQPEDGYRYRKPATPFRHTPLRAPLRQSQSSGYEQPPPSNEYGSPEQSTESSPSGYPASQEQQPENGYRYRKPSGPSFTFQRAPLRAQFSSSKYQAPAEESTSSPQGEYGPPPNEQSTESSPSGGYPESQPEDGYRYRKPQTPFRYQQRQESDSGSGGYDQPSNTYGPAETTTTAAPQDTYGPPQNEQSTESSGSGGYPDSYQAPAEEGYRYRKPAKPFRFRQEEPSGSYGTPQTTSSPQEYGPPQNEQSTESSGSGGYPESTQAPAEEGYRYRKPAKPFRYQPTRQEEPSGSYGTPQTTSSPQEYGPPQNEQSTESSSGGYPDSTQAPAEEGYRYRKPAKPFRYQPTSQEQSQGGYDNKPNDSYGPPQEQEQEQDSGAGTTEQPPNGGYLPPDQEESSSGQPQEPNGEYLPPGDQRRRPAASTNRNVRFQGALGRANYDYDQRQLTLQLPPK